MITSLGGRPMARDIVKALSGTLYEIQYVVHSTTLNEDVYACYRLSSYDGMPIGGLAWIPVSELTPDDRIRLRARKENR